MIISEEWEKGQTPDPINHVLWRPAAELQANHYNPNVVMTPELRLLERSIVSDGWIQPILTDPRGTVIDGFHRWRLAQESPELLERYGGWVPTAVLVVEPWKAKVITVRMNRAKGTHLALRMHELVRALIDDDGLDPQQVAAELGMHSTEVDTLYAESIFKARRLDQAPYSEAWVPEER